MKMINFLFLKYKLLVYIYNSVLHIKRYSLYKRFVLNKFYKNAMWLNVLKKKKKPFR